MNALGTAPPAAIIGQDEMQDLANHDVLNHSRTASVVSILPYRLKALKRRQRMARAAALAVMPAPQVPTPAPAARLCHAEPGPLRAGIRHTASGRMTVIHSGIETAIAMLAERAAGRRGLIEDERLEAVAIDGERAVFAGFWPA